MADADRKLGAARTFADRHAEVSRIPGLDGVPGEELAVFEDDVSRRVDDDCGVVGILVRIGIALHDGKDAVDAGLLAGFREGIGLRSGNIAEEFVGQPLGGIQSLRAVLREHDELDARIASFGCMDRAHDARDLAVDIFPAVDDRGRELDCRDKKSELWLAHAADRSHTFLRP